MKLTNRSTKNVSHWRPSSTSSSSRPRRRYHRWWVVHHQDDEDSNNDSNAADSCRTDDETLSLSSTNTGGGGGGGHEDYDEEVPRRKALLLLPRRLPLLPTFSSSSTGVTTAVPKQQHKKKKRKKRRCCCFWLSKKQCSLALLLLLVSVLYYMLLYKNVDFNFTTDDDDDALSPLNDKTVMWSSFDGNDNKKLHHHRRHAWLEYENNHGGGLSSSLLSLKNNTTTTTTTKPDYMLVLTNYGWNQRNQRRGLRFSRSLRQSNLLQGIVNHVNFHPTAYQEIMAGKRAIDPDVTYYVFLDVETCFEANSPIYKAGYSGNCDRTGNRWYGEPKLMTCYQFKKCWYISQALESPLLLADDDSNNSNNNNKLIVFDCRGNGQFNFRSETVTTEKLALATMSSVSAQVQGTVDQGLPPPANKAVALTATQKRQIADCSSENHRPYLVSFSGRLKKDSIRQQLAELDDNNSNNDDAATNNVVITETAELFNRTNGDSYSDLLVKSKFAAAPRGDNPFSYRFTEALSAGAIPVVLADDWVLPFRPEVVDWSDCAVRIPERSVAQTVEILSSINDTQRCRMRQACYDIYTNYMLTSDRTISGIIEGLEAIRKRQS